MNSLFVFVVFVVPLCSVYSQRSPTISAISQEKVVSIGDTLELECTVQYASDYSVVWLKTDPQHPSDNLFISSGTSVLVPDQRYAVTYDEPSGKYTLKISKVQEIDKGRYECQIITSPTSKEQADVWVYVRLPPVISDNSTRSVITSIGTTIDMYCYATGYPPPRVSWRRENNDLLPNGKAMFIGNRFTIFNITKDDRGTYYCVADNGVGRGARRNIGVEVEFPPYVTVDRLRYGQALQYDMILECHIEAFPSPSVMWIKDGVEINNNQHYAISIYSTADEFTDTTLRIITAEKRQYGHYTCKAGNKFGSDEKRIEFFETPNIICPPACDSGPQINHLYQSGGYASYGGSASCPGHSKSLLFFIFTLFIILRKIFLKD